MLRFTSSLPDGAIVLHVLLNFHHINNWQDECQTKQDIPQSFSEEKSS